MFVQLSSPSYNNKEHLNNSNGSNGPKFDSPNNILLTESALNKSNSV